MLPKFEVKGIWFSVSCSLEPFPTFLNVFFELCIVGSSCVHIFFLVFWFCSQLWGPTEATFSSWVLSCEILRVSLAECLQNFNIGTSVFSFCKLCLQFGTVSDNFECFCFLSSHFCSCILVLFSALGPNGGHVLVVGPVM